MATLAPDPLPVTATAGERTVAAALRQHLPGGVVWYEPRLPVAPRRVLRPDFLVLGRRGLVVLEVKGWRRRDVLDAGPNRVELERGRAGSPEVQAFRYTIALRALLGADPTGAVPVRDGLVLPFIARPQLAAAPWAAALDPAHLITRDDLGRDLPARLRALPPADAAVLAPATVAALHSLLAARLALPAPPADAAQPVLFDDP